MRKLSLIVSLLPYAAVNLPSSVALPPLPLESSSFIRMDTLVFVRPQQPPPLTCISQLAFRILLLLLYDLFSIRKPI